MSQDAPAGRQSPAGRRWTSANPEPRSPVLRGLLYATSAIAWSVAAGTLTSIWEHTPLVRWLTTNAAWFVWPLGLAIALYVTHRVFVLVVGPAPTIDAAIRDGELVPPAPSVPEEAAGPATDRDRRPLREPGQPAQRLLLRALSGVGPGDGKSRRNLRTFDADAILAVHDAVVSAFESGIARGERNPSLDRLCGDLRGNSARILHELVEQGHLRLVGSGRYHVESPERWRDLTLLAPPPAPTGGALPDEPPSSTEEALATGTGVQQRPAVRRLEERLADQALEAALPALLRHFAGLAGRWAGALEHRQHAGAAARWFSDKEPDLRKLILACKPSEHQQAGVIRDIAQLADALDQWYVRESGSDESGRDGDLDGREGDPSVGERAAEVAAQVGNLAEGAAKPVLRQLAEIRWRAARRRSAGEAAGAEWAEEAEGTPAAQPAGRPTAAEPPRLHRLAVALHARELHETALRDLTRLHGDHARLDDVESTLYLTWRSLPRAEVGNVVATLINLAIVHLYQGRFEGADDRLELALSLTRNDIAPAGRAHALELRGIVAWTRGHARRATSLWHDAYHLFDELGVAHGRRRCARHLASVLPEVPALEGVLGELVAPDDHATPLWEELLACVPKTDKRLRARLAEAGRAAEDRRQAARSQRPPAPPPARWRQFLARRFTRLQSRR